MTKRNTYTDLHESVLDLVIPKTIVLQVMHPLKLSPFLCARKKSRSQVVPILTPFDRVAREARDLHRTLEAEDVMDLQLGKPVLRRVQCPVCGVILRVVLDVLDVEAPKDLGLLLRGKQVCLNETDGTRLAGDRARRVQDGFRSEDSPHEIKRDLAIGQQGG